MENKFYTDDFEQFLKETADDFRMYPSKRVWNSLYNNLHPGRKWPSLAVCLLLISSIVFIGLAHKNEITGSTLLAGRQTMDTNLAAYNNKSSRENIEKTSYAQINPVISALVQPIKPNDISAVEQSSYSTDKLQPVSAEPTSGTNYNAAATVTTNGPTVYNKRKKRFSTARTATISINSNEPAFATNDNSNTNTGLPVNHQPGSFAKSIVDNQEPTGQDVLLLGKTSIAIPPTGSTLNENKDDIKSPIQQPVLTAIKNNKIKEDKEWMEDYAFHNQPYTSFKSKLSTQLYFTPSIGYRKLKKTVNYDVAARPSATGVNAQEFHNSLLHDPALNMEAGYSFLYAYSKLVRLKGGIQVNYTNYKVHANELGHSNLTNILLNDASGGLELSQRSTSLANLNSHNASERKLNNSSFQVSLPIGADIKIAGKHNFQWFVGATIQPTYVAFGNTYLVSSDAKNYVYDNHLSRHWNMNAGLETFISYRTKTGITFTAGPQFRYQLLSTYKKKYSYDENLYNSGIKIGMIKNL